MILIISTSVFVGTVLSSCSKSYNCKCTYVAMSGGAAAGEPNKEETSKVKGNTIVLADISCKMNEDKYFTQGFDGNCGIQ